MKYLLNGGAIIAILALIGNMYGKQTGDRAIFTRFLHAIIPAFIPLSRDLFLPALCPRVCIFEFQAPWRRLHLVLQTCCCGFGVGS